METLLSYDWHTMMPEFIIVGFAILLSLLDLFLGKKVDRRKLGWVGFVGVLVAFVSLLFLLPHESTEILFNTFRFDSFGKAFKLLLLVGTMLVFVLAIHDDEKEIQDRGEYYYLFLTALLGAMFMVSSGDLITLFVGLELLSISSYILVAIRKKNRKSNEAALKYVINGGISTAITLFGLSYIYGLTGSTNIQDMSIFIQTGNLESVQGLIGMAFLLTFVGLSFKLATMPFHMWAPDVYEGASTPVTAFLGAVSKVAGFAIVLRLFLSIFGAIPMDEGQSTYLLYMQGFIAVVAAITMIIGNTIALKQVSVKRMLAYSSIAHAGYLLVPFMAFSPFLMDNMWFYLLAYLFMNIGALAVVQVVQRAIGSDHLTSFSGLYKRSPLLAVLLTIFLLSLAGIPGTAGFIGKVHIFLSAFVVEPAHYVLAAILMGTTVISYYYYFSIIQQMFFRQPDKEETIRPQSGLLIVGCLCAVATIVLGIFPFLAYEFFFQYFDVLKDFLG
ncbi:NADH-quinone oxidoreductase subunit NuoN [Priestia taiwanensis]|nr:NADH-quinone oxidoreductase subunit NuoN [Priestia taiwanensis]